MATIRFRNVAVKAISACVPKKAVPNTELKDLLGEEEVKKTIESVGIREKRFADDNTTAADLCQKAAEKLFADNDIDKQSIDVLLFMSQLPDYRIPATAPILQKRLGLPKTTACMDLSLACSGYVYALSTAMAYASMEGINRVLLLDGETMTKLVNPKDKVDAPLYGDAGTATLVEKCQGEKATFVLYSDGEGEDSVKIKGGAGRFPTTPESLVEHTNKEGNTYNDLQIFMDGMDVFNFVLRCVPKSIKEVVKMDNIDLNDVSYLLLHQANKFMTDFIVKRLKYPLGRVPYSLDRFGNTSSASIPLTISSELSQKDDVKDVIMSGFGAGLSWATAHVDLSNCHISPVIDY